MFTLRVARGREASDARPVHVTGRRVLIGSAPSADVQLARASEVEAVLEADAQGVRLWRGGEWSQVVGRRLHLDETTIEFDHDPERVSAPWVDAPPASRWRRPGFVSRAWVHDGFGARVTAMQVEARVVLGEGHPQLVFSMPNARGRNLFLHLSGAVVDEDWAISHRVCGFTEVERGRISAPFFPGARLCDLALLFERRRQAGQGEPPAAVMRTLAWRVVEVLVSCFPSGALSIDQVAVDPVVGWDGQLSIRLAPAQGAGPRSLTGLALGAMRALGIRTPAVDGEMDKGVLLNTTLRRAMAAGGVLPDQQIADFLAALLPRDRAAQLDWLEGAI